MAPARTIRALISCATGLALAVAVLTVAPEAARAAPAIAWGPCTYEPLLGLDVECGRLAVPMDRTDPGGPTFSLAVARYRATGTPQERIGSLLFNPGGPGGSGLDTLRAAWSLLPAGVRERFDLVTWDPRGVGQTTPAVAACPLPSFEVPLGQTLDLQAVGDAYAAGMTPVHAACQAANEDVIAHLGTNEAVADLEALRIAVGDPKLSYLGWSYGTRIGYDYAVTYPDRVRAMVLDSPMDPTQTMSSAVEGSLAGVQALTVFLRLHPAAARQLWEVRDALQVHSVRLAGVVTMTALDLMSYVQLLAANQADYPYLAEQIDNLHTAVLGTGAARRHAQQVAVIRLMEAYGPFQSGDWWVGPSISCIDLPQRPTVAEMVPVARLLAADVGAVQGLDAVLIPGMCAGYTFPPDPVPTVAPGEGPDVPMMIVGSSRDGRTPGMWLERLGAAFPSARTITYRGGQHVVWGTVGSWCVDRPLTTFMLTGRQPVHDRTCPNTFAVGELIP